MMSFRKALVEMVPTQPIYYFGTVDRYVVAAEYSSDEHAEGKAHRWMVAYHVLT